MTQEVATEVLTPLPTAAEAVEGAAPEEGATPEATPAPGEQGEEQAAPFDPYEFLEREDVKPVLERRDQRKEEELQQSYEARFQERTASWESQQAYQTLNGWMGRIDEKLDEGDPDGAVKLIEGLTRVMGPYSETAQRQLLERGAASAALQIGKKLQIGLEKADLRTRDEFDAAIRSGKSWEDLFGMYVKAQTGSVEAAHKAELEAKDRLIEELKAGGRVGLGPNGASTGPSTSGAAGGLSYEQLMAMPIDQYEKVPEEDRRRIINDWTARQQQGSR